MKGKLFAAFITILVAVGLVYADSTRVIPSGGSPSTQHVILEAGKSLGITSGGNILFSDSGTVTFGDDLTITDTLTVVTVTASGTVTGEQLTSTDDATIADDLTMTAGDVILTAGDIVVADDRGVGSGTAAKTVKVCGGVAGAGCDAEAIGAWIKLEGVDFGGAGVGGAVEIKAGAGDLTSDVIIGTNLDAADIVFNGGTTPATLLTIESDSGTITQAKGNHAASGTITSAATGTIGWSVVAGADTACSTTCTSACVFGVNTAATEADIVDCADATADECLCAGAS